MLGLGIGIRIGLRLGLGPLAIYNQPFFPLSPFSVMHFSYASVIQLYVGYVISCCSLTECYGKLKVMI